MEGVRQRPVPQRQHDLDQADDARGGLRVSDVRLQGTQIERSRGWARASEHLRQGVGLDRVAEGGAGAVRLDVVDVRRGEPGRLQGSAGSPVPGPGRSEPYRP